MCTNHILVHRYCDDNFACKDAVSGTDLDDIDYQSILFDSQPESNEVCYITERTSDGWYCLVLESDDGKK
jgi:hypothetical protein